MSRMLILELSDEVYAEIQRHAEVTGTSPARWLSDTLEQNYGPIHAWQNAPAQRTATERQAARARFERHFGEVDLANAIGADNERIDADLAREYADPHEAP